MRRQTAVQVATVIFLLLASMLVPAWAQIPGEPPAGPVLAPGRGTEVRQDLPDGASQGWWSAVRKEIEAREYNFSPCPGGVDALYQAPNRAHGFVSRLDERGVRLVPMDLEASGWEWGLELITSGGKTPAVRARDNRIELSRGGITEWYVNGEEGLEQGFSVARPQSNDGRLNIDMKLSGNLHPKFSGDGQAIDFYGGSCVGVLRYARLKVTDATGEILTSRFEPIEGGIRIAIGDATAIYPVTVDPLATSHAWYTSGEAASNYYGYSVATAGDVNGDGYSDVIVGAWGYDPGSGADTGRAYLYLGSESGLSTAASWTGTGDAAGSKYGCSVATAGDVNGDGYSDVIVGACGYDPGSGANTGRAYLYLGSASGLSTSASWTGTGEAASNRYGFSVATAGDVNGDGYSDVIVGASGFDPGSGADTGRAYLYLGSASGLSTVASWTGTGDAAGSNYGYSLATAGDVNGDGYGDVVVGAPHHPGGGVGRGRAYLYLGAVSGLSPSASWTVSGDAENSCCGISVATAGDVNGDGYSDVVVGAYLHSGGGVGRGRAYLYLGAVSGLSPTASWTGTGDADFARYGCSVAPAGDVNGDGYSDVVVGADGSNGNKGKAYLYLGSASGLGIIAAWTTEGNQEGAIFGCSVATAGDVNGDGYCDVIVGASGYDPGSAASTGRAYLYHGSASGLGTAAGWTGTGDTGNLYYGYSVATAGDVDGDGYSDVVVGAYGYDPGSGANTGRAYLYHGSESGLSGTASWTADGESAGSFFGRSVAGAGDVNGDGYSDVVLGADGFNGNKGKAYLYLGSATGLSPTATWAFAESGTNARFGASVASAGDVNGDGYSDVVAGAYGGGKGKAYLFLGSPSGLSTSESWTHFGEASGNLFGCSVASAGDVNRDGFSDVIIGAKGYGSNAGRAYLFPGSASGLPDTASWTATGEAANDFFGACVATAGDVNGDGYSDLLAGAYGFGGNSGKAYLYLGSASGPMPSASWPATGEAADHYFGACVASAGDVNGDGYADALVGAYGYGTNAGKAYLFLGSASGLSGTASWTTTGEAANHYFGSSVATAGDVNGDGFADVLAGAYGFGGNAGRAYLFWGNGEAGRGLSLNPRQRRADDSAPLDRLGKTDDGHSFRLAALGRSPYGRMRVKLQWEVKPLGAAFDGLGTRAGSAWTDTGAAGAALGELVTSLTAVTPYHWRARLIYHPGATPFQQGSRWFTRPWAGWQETDLRTPVGVPFGLVNNTAEDIAVCEDTGLLVTWPSDPPDWGDGGSGTRTYSVLRDGAVLQAGIAYGTTTFTDTTGTNGTSYLYQVRYTNGAGLSADTVGAWAGDDFILPPQAAWVPLGSGVNGTVRALLWNGTHLFAGGFFTTAGGAGARNIAVWDGFKWGNLGSGFNGPVYAMAWDGSNLYAGGDFTASGAVAVNHIAKWDGTQWSALGSGIHGVVYTLSWDGTTLFAGGSFTSAGGVSVTSIAKWQNGQWSAHGWLYDNSTVYAYQDDFNDYIGGDIDGTIHGCYLQYWQWGDGWNCLDGQTDSYILALAKGENWYQVYAGGDFVYVDTGGNSLLVSHIAKWDGSTWSKIGDGFNDQVLSLVREGAKLYAGGVFTKAFGFTPDVSHVAVWDGVQWSSMGTGLDGNVYALALQGTILYAGGEFTYAGGVGTSHVARWALNTPLEAPAVEDIDFCGATGVRVTWDAVDGATGYDLQVDGGTIVPDVTSPFDYLPGDTELHTYRVRAKNPCGAWDWTGATGGVDDHVVCAAPTGLANNAAADANSCADMGVTVTWAADPSNWGDSGFGTRSYSVLREGTVIQTGIIYGTTSYTDVTGTNGTSYIYKVRYVNGAGYSTDTAGASASDVNLTPNTWNAIGPGIIGTVHTIIQVGTDLYVAGEFSSVGGYSANNIAKWNGGSWSAVGSGTDGTVYALAWDGTNLYAGGDFTTAGGVPANRIARWDGMNWSALGSGLGGSGQSAVRALACDGTKLFAGGKFSTAGSVSASNIAKWEGGNWSALGAGTDNDVYALAWDGTRLVAGGRFVTVGGVTASNIAKWEGGSWGSLGSGTNSWVFALAWRGTDLYVGGKFTSAGGASASSIARWNGSSWSPLGSGTNGGVYALAWGGTDLFAGGTFSAAGGQTAERIARWNGSSWSILGSGLDGDVNVLAWDGTDLFAGGIFTWAGGVSVNRVAIWTTPGSPLSAPSVSDTYCVGVTISWAPAGSATGYDILVDGTVVLPDVTSPHTYLPGDSAPHTYRVRAKNACGYWDWSEGSEAADTSAIPEIATGSSSSDAQTWAGMVQSWPAASPAPTGYRLYRGTAADLPALLNASTDFCKRYEGTQTSLDCSADDPSGVAGSCYYYLVTAYTGECEGPAGYASSGWRQVNSAGACTP